ncbi:hypothetical protein [Rathayibacter iranicus]|uniref:Uncharacterized protein n=1 Tax=Rathayibacter iranicus TaxID=59737 RepID=A0AAD2JG45_9MICO|nr:hypothetical protein [Rathayibacter iranicus]AZZ54964.1 hypothetical protein C7V51_02995 [Rathayibacter iranicus]MWV32314.1 hypothetical protein [Rathayibacter iranicus NCPPB 2253 = VKM Ac-1602]PPI62348.1 hypothetical protein C5E08_03000 [Rathayibacter iranicus]
MSGSIAGVSPVRCGPAAAVSRVGIASASRASARAARRLCLFARAAERRATSLLALLAFVFGVLPHGSAHGPGTVDGQEHELTRVPQGSAGRDRESCLLTPDPAEREQLRLADVRRGGGAGAHLVVAKADDDVELRRGDVLAPDEFLVPTSGAPPNSGRGYGRPLDGTSGTSRPEGHDDRFVGVGRRASRWVFIATISVSSRSRSSTSM